MDQTTDEQFVSSYIAAWSTRDGDERRSLIDRVYAADATFYANEPGDEAVQRHGRTEIMENITQVNERLTQGSGLATQRTAFAANHDLLRVSWQMTTPEGDVAMSGMNLLIRNSDGRVVRDYILIG